MCTVLWKHFGPGPSGRSTFQKVEINLDWTVINPHSRKNFYILKMNANSCTFPIFQNAESFVTHIFGVRNCMTTQLHCLTDIPHILTFDFLVNIGSPKISVFIYIFIYQCTSNHPSIHSHSRHSTCILYTPLCPLLLLSWSPLCPLRQTIHNGGISKQARVSSQGLFLVVRQRSVVLLNTL